jgi:hypothetical protein
MWRWCALALVFGCGGGDKDAADGGDGADADTDTDTDTDVPGEDADGDGFSPPEDCDDGNDAVNPGADEVCDGADNDCDGTTDLEPVEPVYYADFDQDGYGDPNDGIGSCFPVALRVEENTDCDDTQFDVNPGHIEWCNDGRDDDCNPATGEDGTISLAGIGWYANLQAAIDAAVNGDVVDVCAGTYEEPITTSKAITLLGKGRDITVIDALGNAPAFRIYAGALIRVEAITLQNGYGDYGGCIASSTGELEIASARLVGCTAAQGGALFFEGVRATFTDSEILDSSASGEGGAIYAGLNSEVNFTGGTVSGCTAADGAAGYGFRSSDFAFDGTTVEGNTASSLGGGFALLDGSTLSLTGGTLVGNTADIGGGVFLSESFVATVGTDLGAGATDNLPEDVFQVDTAASYGWDGVADVSCAPFTACTP